MFGSLRLIFDTSYQQYVKDVLNEHNCVLAVTVLVGPSLYETLHIEHDSSPAIWFRLWRFGGQPLVTIQWSSKGQSERPYVANALIPAKGKDDRGKLALRVCPDWAGWKEPLPPLDS